MRIIRMQSRLTRAALARAIGAAPAVVARIEEGRLRFGAARLIALSIALGAPVSRFFRAPIEASLRHGDARARLQKVRAAFCASEE
ncbi:MAG: helix-turn-helix domain-containing protein [Parvularculaceae bacterium]|nr:helix-turn-helix domain-containing protein [Parvularculaceae bacterium]